jgi:hypothetical protein
MASDLDSWCTAEAFVGASFISIHFFEVSIEWLLRQSFFGRVTLP